MNNQSANKNLISILMPVKNASHYLKECLDSIIEQEFKNWELIAVNDHSTDGSEIILDAYTKKDKRIHKLDNRGKGIIEALRLAYKSSNGNFITRMDADDLMTPNKLKVMHAQLADFSYGHIALGQVKYFSENELGEGYKRYASWLNNMTAKGENWKDLYKECVIPSPCWMVHKVDLERAGAFESELWPEDYDLCFRFYMAGLKCIPTQQILHQWRDYAERTSRNDPHYADNRFFDLKLHYFLKMHPRSDQNLVLLGAGKKGKAIAAKLIEESVNFSWLSNNTNKIDKDIYGKFIQSQDLLESIVNPVIMIAISNPEEQIKIEKQVLKIGLVKGMHYHFFC